MPLGSFFSKSFRASSNPFLVARGVANESSRNFSTSIDLPSIGDYILGRENLREKISAIFKQIITREMKSFQFPSIAAEKLQRDNEHKSHLQGFYKTSLAFNPLHPLVDLRFLEKQTSDSVYDLFLKHVRSELGTHIFPLRAISGGGKTG